MHREPDLSSAHSKQRVELQATLVGTHLSLLQKTGTQHSFCDVTLMMDMSGVHSRDTWNRALLLYQLTREKDKEGVSRARQVFHTGQGSQGPLGDSLECDAPSEF